MRGFTRKIVVLCAALSIATAAMADDDRDEIDSELISDLQESISDLQAQVKALNERVATNTVAALKSTGEVDYSPKFFGALMATYNISTESDISRFNVRNSRFGFKGKASRSLGYAVQVDFHNQGSVSILDSYINFKSSNLEVKLGQQQIHLTKDLDRGASSNLFTTRSFAAIYSTSYRVDKGGDTYSLSSLGSRDIGLYAKYKFDTEIPIAIAAGAFNGTGINNATWDSESNYTFQLALGGKSGLSAAASYYFGETPLDQSIDIYSAEVAYNGSNIFAEAVFQQRAVEQGGVSLKTNFALVQGYYTISTPKSPLFDNFAPTLRWDYADNLDYINSNDSTLTSVDLHRVTAAVNFSLSGCKVRSRLSVGYEFIFMNHSPSDFKDNTLAQDKFTIGLITAF